MNRGRDRGTTPHRGPPTMNRSTRNGDEGTTTTVITRTDLLCPVSSYKDLDRNLKRFVNETFYRLVLFVSNPKNLSTDQLIYKAVRKHLGLDTQNNQTCLGWWNTTGKQTYCKTLNSKRTTLSSAIKLQFKSKLTSNMYFCGQYDERS